MDRRPVGLAKELSVLSMLSARYHATSEGAEAEHEPAVIAALPSYLGRMRRSGTFDRLSHAPLGIDYVLAAREMRITRACME
jgi:hypothetical protein